MASVIKVLKSTFMLIRPISCLPIQTISTTEVSLKYSKIYTGKIHHLQSRKKQLMERGNYMTNRRNEYIEWNAEAERFSFCKRINEDINDALLITTFNAVNFDEGFSNAGKLHVKEFCCRYLRWTWPTLPEEGINAACSYLMSDETVANVAAGIGMKDLIVSSYIPTTETLRDSFYSLVNAIKKSTGEAKSEKFILDLLISQLVGRDIWDSWELENPYSAVETILLNSGKEPAIPRVLGLLGKKTIEQVARVGIYSNRQLLGEGCEHTFELAMKLAAFDCLSNFFKHDISRSPLGFGEITEDLHQFNQRNVSLTDWKLDDCTT